MSFGFEWRDGLLIVFFTTIGLSANLRMLAAGGRMLTVLTLVAVVNLSLQDGIGTALANLLGANPANGSLAGSIGLSGGHGTAIAWAPTLKGAFGRPNAAEIGAAGRRSGPLSATCWAGLSATF